MSQSRKVENGARRFAEGEQEPQPNNGRDERGRFAVGNVGGPGNPFARQVAKLRSALVRRVTEEDMELIAERLIVLGRSGDLAAMKLLFLYVLGKPAEAVNPDTLDVEEWRQCYQPLEQIMKQVPVTMATLPAEVACGMVAHIQPCRVQQLAEMLSPTPQPSEERRESTDSCQDETSGDNEGQEATPAPSTNGRNGAAKKRKSPSTNGHHGGERGVKNGASRAGPARRERRGPRTAPAAKSPAIAANGASARSRPKPARPIS